MKTAQELKSKLAQHYGSETFFRHPFNRHAVYTEGVRCFAESAGNGAFWLLDILCTEPAILKEAQDFASITLTVEQGGAVLAVTDGGKGGNEPETVFRRKLSFTDCPEGIWSFYFENMTIMLPSER